MDNQIDSNVCALCGGLFGITVQEKELLFKFGVPNPKLCSNCRLQRRYAMRNERVFYNRKCDLTDQPIVSIFHEESPYTVYSQDAWWSDDWDQFKFGKDYDLTRPFFEQLKELQLQQPRIALLAKDSDNSEYTNHSAHNKDCYIGFSLVNCEKVLYGYFCFDVSYLVDCTNMFNKSELCYECFNCHQCYGCVYTVESRGCTNVWFSYDMSGCEDCFLSWNLRNAKYCYMNEQLTKEEYEKKVAEFKVLSDSDRRKLIEQWRDNIKNKAIHQSSRFINTENSTGDYLANCTNVNNGFVVTNGENSANLLYCVDVKDVMDCCNTAPAEFCYEMTGTINNNHSKFINYSYDNDFIEYCDHVFNSQYLFGCVCLNKQKYCILNKQYTESEYERLKVQIIAQMKKDDEYGEFFPFSYSPFAYNETLANDLFPLTPEHAETLGARWLDERKEGVNRNAVIDANDLPEMITEVDNSILEKTIICEDSGKPFQIKSQELEIYRKLGVPLPRKHPEVRYQDRLTLRTPLELHDRECSKCGISLISTYSSTRPETVYCDKCYKEVIY
ncbi:MAG: hypothetical protein Q8P90_01170 [bacterium]|nr:hypothetical protein [bacterium]